MEGIFIKYINRIIFMLYIAILLGFALAHKSVLNIVGFYNSDKIFHFLVFYLGIILLFLGEKKWKSVFFIISLIFLICLPPLIEFFQGLNTYRVSDIEDTIFGYMGIISGAITSFVIIILKKLIKNKVDRKKNKSYDPLYKKEN